LSPENANLESNMKSNESKKPDKFTVDYLMESVGKEIMVSPWITMSQEEVNLFGQLTRDLDPNHIDPGYAREHSPFGGTVLFGFQTLAMLSHLCEPLRLDHAIDSTAYEVNYGLNKVRFITPVRVGASFRNRMSVKSVERRDDGAHMLITLNTIEVEGQEKPAMTAEWLSLIHYGEGE